MARTKKPPLPPVGSWVLLNDDVKAWRKTLAVVLEHGAAKQDITDRAQYQVQFAHPVSGFCGWWNGTMCGRLTGDTCTNLSHKATSMTYTKEYSPGTSYATDTGIRNSLGPNLSQPAILVMPFGVVGQMRGARTLNEGRPLWLNRSNLEKDLIVLPGHHNFEAFVRNATHTKPEWATIITANYEVDRSDVLNTRRLAANAMMQSLAMILNHTFPKESALQQDRAREFQWSGNAVPGDVEHKMDRQVISRAGLRERLEYLYLADTGMNQLAQGRLLSLVLAYAKARVDKKLVQTYLSAEAAYLQTSGPVDTTAQMPNGWQDRIIPGLPEIVSVGKVEPDTSTAP